MARVLFQAGRQPGDLRLKAENLENMRRDDRRGCRFWRLLRRGWRRRHERQQQPYVGYHRLLLCRAALCAVRRMKQVLCIACSAPTWPQRQQRRFPLKFAQSVFIGVTRFVSGSGWFVSTQERGLGELGLDWGRGGNGTCDSAACESGCDELSSDVSEGRETTLECDGCMFSSMSSEVRSS